MEVDDVETDPDWVRQMGRLTACELILIARPGVEIKLNRNFSEQSEFPFELSYKGHQIAIGRHEDSVWRDALCCGVLGQSACHHFALIPSRLQRSEGTREDGGAWQAKKAEIVIFQWMQRERQ